MVAADCSSRDALGVSTGVEELDQVLGGLLPGDNVVWVAPPGTGSELFEERFLAAAAAAGHVGVSVFVDGSPAVLRTRLPDETTILDARPGRRNAGPAA